MNTNDKIIEILKQHPEGGETFFNALDLMLRSDFDILAELKELIGKNITNLKNVNIILSGHFGIALINNNNFWLSQFKNFYLIQGGLRGNDEGEFLKDYKTDSSENIFVDDSFYSGTTRNKIDSLIKGKGLIKGINSTFVIYDGSPLIQKDVHSLFKYYKK